ncbi:MAG: inorganic phosphate transporter [Microcoleaceae cyanobacterium]
MMSWLLLLIIAGLAFYMASNLGANDVANSMGTSVGSKALTLKQAIVVAGILEFAGAVLFGREVSETLVTKVVNPEIFVTQPQVYGLGMMVVLLTCGLWLQIATSQGWPVSSSHAVVGAIAGFSWVAAGWGAVDWSSIRLISFTWVITPVVSGLISNLFYGQIKRWILDQPDPFQQLAEWIPWLSVAVMSVFGVIVLPKITQPVQLFMAEEWQIDLPVYDLPIFIGAIATITITVINWRRWHSWQKTGTAKTTDSVEAIFGHYQIISACFVAFAHGSNDVGNAVAPLAAIAHILKTGMVPLEGFSVPLWVLILGGLGIVTGLSLWGYKVIGTVGEDIIALRPSGGFCAELATAATVLLASRVGLPVSTSHALVGAVVGIGVAQGMKSIKFQTIKGILAAWLLTIPAATLFSVLLFSILIRFVLGLA